MYLPFTRLYRLAEILLMFAYYRLDQHYLKWPILAPLRCLLCLDPRSWKNKLVTDPNIRLRYCLEKLGPIFIKLGQALAVRSDLIGTACAAELAMLQDRVTPFSNPLTIIEKQYHYPLKQYFKHIDPEALAAASIAQVHAGILQSGAHVVLKVIRPGIQKKIQIDLKTMRLLAHLLLCLLPRSTRLQPLALIRELEQTLNEELDLIREGANATQMKRHFEGDPKIYIPNIYWEFSQKNILVMEKINGISISDHATLKAKGFDLGDIAKQIISLFFKQIFKHNFFHADLHPGNLFIDPEQLGLPRLILVDFGIIGGFNQKDRSYLAQNFYALLQKDYYRIAELHIESHWVPPSVRVDEFTHAVRAICEPILDRPMGSVSCAQLLSRLFEVGRKFDMILLPQLLLLQKTLFAVEGLGRSLDPGLNLWDIAKPEMTSWMKSELGIRQFFKEIRTALPYLKQLKSVWFPHLLDPKHLGNSSAKPNFSWKSFLLGNFFSILSIFFLKKLYLI